MELSGQLHAPAVLPPGKQVPGTHCVGSWIDPQSRSERCGVQKNLLPLSGIDIRPIGR
jgi:hypothetical protein